MLDSFVFEVELKGMVAVLLLNEIKEDLDCAFWDGLQRMGLAKLLVNVRELVDEEDLMDVDFRPFVTIFLSI